MNALGDPDNPDYEKRVDWLQEVHGAFDREHFELDTINVWLGHLKLLRRHRLSR